MTSKRQTAALRVPFLLLLSLLVKPSSARPSLLVTSAKSKCVNGQVPGGMTIGVHYDVPDLPETGPLWITIQATLPRDTFHVIQADRRRNHQMQHPPKSEQISNKRGIAQYTILQDSDVTLCLRSSAASLTNPILFSFHVSLTPTATATEQQQQQNEKKANDTATNNTSMMERHLSLYERQITNMLNDMTEILGEADFAKDREKAFHEQSVSMHAASMWWPIVQLGILCVLGFTQANHVVHFFKSRHVL